VFSADPDIDVWPSPPGLLNLNFGSASLVDIVVLGTWILPCPDKTSRAVELVNVSLD
jgi:hypothetical protein